LAGAEKCLVAATKNLFVVPNFVAATKPFFPVKESALGIQWDLYSLHDIHQKVVTSKVSACTILTIAF